MIFAIRREKKAYLRVQRDGISRVCGGLRDPDIYKKRRYSSVLSNMDNSGIILYIPLHLRNDSDRFLLKAVDQGFVL